MPPRKQTYSEVFEEQCPQYIAMGMTYDEFWNQDPSRVIPYRKAFKLKRDMENHRLWLQGMYFYEALCDASPIFHDLAKPGTKAKPYPSEPYEVYGKETVTADEEIRQNEQKLKNGRDAMIAMMLGHNAQFAKKQEGGDVNGTS